MSDEQYTVEFRAEFAQINSAIKTLAERLGTMEQKVATTDKSLSAISRTTANASKAASDYAKAIGAVGTATGSAGSATAKASRDMQSFSNTARATAKELKAAAAASAQFANASYGTGSRNAQTGRFQKNSPLYGSEGIGRILARDYNTGAGNATSASLTRVATNSTQFFTGASRAMADAAAKTKQAAIAAAEADAKYQGLANTRYALYDVSRTMAAITAATLGTVAAALHVSATFESVFAQVKRTSQTSGAQFEDLKQSLIDLSTAIPVSIQDIGAVATLAGQLGIAAKSIDSFTESVVMFSATTNVAPTQAAESLGRIAQLAGVGAGEYDNLASAVYQAGITSVSTEADILSVTQQIAVSARQIGFTADQTVALSSALASLGVAPERARGSIQRVFNIITTSVDNADEKLASFAALSGKSSADFQTQWKTDAQGAFLSFLQGLGSAGSAGQNMNNILSDLGINAVRDTDALKRLAQNTEVYANAIDQSTSAYASGTALADGYAQISDTLNARLQVLAQSLTAITNSVSDSGPFKVLVSLIQRLADSFLTISNSAGGKTGKVLGAIVGVVLVLTGSLTALVGVAALGVASIFALTTSLRFMEGESFKAISPIELLKQTLMQFIVASNLTAESNAGAAVSFRALAVAARTSAIGMKTARAALVSTGVGAALVAVSFGVEALINHFDSLEERLGKSLNDFSGLADAIKGDTETFKTTGDRLGEVTKKMGDFKEPVQSAKEAYAEFAQANILAQKPVEGTTAAMADQIVQADTLTLSLGALTEAWYRNELANSDVGKALFAASQDGRLPAGFDVNAYLDASMSDPTGEKGKVQAYLDSVFPKQFSAPDFKAPQVASTGNFVSDANALQSLNDQYVLYSALTSKSKDFTDAIRIQTDEIARGAFFSKVAAGSKADLLQKQDELTAEFEAAQAALADNTKTLQDNATAAFASSDSLASLSKSYQDLGASLQENGLDFSGVSEASQANLSALEDSVQSAIAGSGGDMDLAKIKVYALRQSLIDMGATAGSLTPLNTFLRGFAPAASQATQVGIESQRAALLLQYGFDKSAASADKAAKSTGSVTKEVRTLTDYVNDLSNIFSNALTFRFGFQQSKDKTLSAFQTIVDAAEDADKAVRDLNQSIMDLDATISGLQSDSEILQYQLSIAVEYGDTLRANAISAELAQNNADLSKAQSDRTDKTNQLSDAELAQAKVLEGNSQAAIDQRKNVDGLVSAYEDQIKAYTNTGASQAEVLSYTRQLRAQFSSQLIQLGYNTTQVEKYALAFDDMAKIISTIPRVLTMTANTDPAQRAIDEFVAKNKSTGSTYTVTTAVNDAALQKFSRGMSIVAQIAQMQARMSDPGVSGNYNAISAISDTIRRYNALLAAGTYDGGGWTGAGTKHEPAGVVHRDEFVFTKEATNHYGVPFLNAMMNQRTPQMYGGGSPNITIAPAGGGMVDLSTGSLQRLANLIGPMVLKLDGQKVAENTNNHNKSFTRTGSR